MAEEEKRASQQMQQDKDALQPKKSSALVEKDYQALYQQALINLAYQKAAANAADPAEVGFDVRGRAVYTLDFTKLTDEEWATLTEGLQETPQKPAQDGESALDKIKQLTGIGVVGVVRCALDLATPMTTGALHQPITALRDQYEKTYKSLSVLNTKTGERMSVVPIYEEILSYLDHQHNALTSYLNNNEETFTEAIQKSFNQGYKTARGTLQQKLAEKIKTQLEENPECLNDIKELNAFLNETRKGLAKEVREEYLQALTFKEAPSLSAEEQLLEVEKRIAIAKALEREGFKKHFVDTPSHEYDMLGTDFANGTVSYITQSGDRTAHNKSEWNDGESALRVQTRHHLSQEGKVRASKHGRISTRLPSIADITNKEEEKDVDKIKGILRANYKTLNEIRPDNKPVVYNLLTSLEGIPDNTFGQKNNQNLSAHRIAKGVHAYNASVLDGTDGQEKLVFLQNIGVNHYTQNLGYDSYLPKALSGRNAYNSRLVREATLMADLAMLYTLSNNFEGTSGHENSYRQVLDQYKGFLNAPNRGEYFSESPEGVLAINAIGEAKEQLKKSVRKGTNESLSSLAAKSLAKMYANDEHHNEQFGNLAQALSIFLEDKSFSGCKSANERNEDVQKRVAMLIALEEKLDSTSVQQALNNNESSKFLSEEEVALLQALQGENTEVLRCTLAKATNVHRAYGDECSFSHADQSSASKLERQFPFHNTASALVHSAAPLIGTGIVLGGASASLALVAAPLLLFAPPVGAALLGFAAIGGIAAAVTVGSGLVAGFLGKAVFGYNTNNGAERELSRVDNSGSSAQQNHKDKGKGIKSAASEVLVELNTKKEELETQIREATEKASPIVESKKNLPRRHSISGSSPDSKTHVDVEEWKRERHSATASLRETLMSGIKPTPIESKAGIEDSAGYIKFSERKLEHGETLNEISLSDAAYSNQTEGEPKKRNSF